MKKTRYFVRPIGDNDIINSQIRSMLGNDPVEAEINFKGEACKVYEVSSDQLAWFRRLKKNPEVGSQFEIYSKDDEGVIKHESAGASKARDQEIGEAIRKASKAGAGEIVIKTSFVEVITGKLVIVESGDWFVYDRATKTLALRKGGVLKAAINGEAGIKTADEKEALRIIAIMSAATGLDFHRRDRLDEIFFEVKAKENKEEARKPSEASQVLKKKAGKIKPSKAVKKKGGKMPAPKKRLGKKK